LQAVTWCKKNLALGDCLALLLSIRFRGEFLDALFGVPAAGSAYSGHAAAVFLDGRDPRPPAAEELRAHLLFLVSRIGFLLWRFFAGAQRTALLHDSFVLIGNLCVDSLVPRSMVSAIATGSPARGICTSPGIAPSRKPKEDLVGCGLCARGHNASVVLRLIAIAQRIRFRVAEQFLGLALSSLARGRVVNFHRMAMAICESGAGRPAEVLS